MTKEEFNKLGIGTILLCGQNYVEITNFNNDDTFDGLLYLPYQWSTKPNLKRHLSLTDVEFFDIPEDKFVSDVISCDNHKIKYDGKGEYTVQINAVEEGSVAIVDVICRDGLVKYFSIPPLGFSFISSVVRKYKM